MIEQICHKDELLAIIIRSNHHKDGIEFYTPDDFSQQLAYMNRPKGYSIEAHVHEPVPRQVHYTQEVLFIRSGRVKVDFYTNDQTYLESRVLNTGDVVLLATGGHGFTMLEPTEIIEVKQGPFAGESDKKRFKPKKG
jgi:mannose-6-phosphate isomerase-like protein (cupin superfamily)